MRVLWVIRFAFASSHHFKIIRLLYLLSARIMLFYLIIFRSTYSYGFLAYRWCFYTAFWGPLMHHVWNSLIHHEALWFTMKLVDSPWNSLIHHETLWFTIILFDSPWNSLIHHYTLWFTMKLFDSPLYSPLVSH